METTLFPLDMDPCICQLSLKAHTVDSFSRGLNIFVISPNNESSIQLFFSGNWSSNDVTSFCGQFEKRGRGLLREAFQSEGEFFLWDCNNHKCSHMLDLDKTCID